MTTAKLPIYDAFCCSCYTACSLVFRKIINFLTRPIVRTSKDSSWYFKPNSQFCTLNKVIFNLLLLHIWKDLNIWIRVNSVNSYVDQYFFCRQSIGSWHDTEWRILHESHQTQKGDPCNLSKESSKSWSLWDTETHVTCDVYVIQTHNTVTC